MKNSEISTKQYVRRILFIVFLTNIPALMFLPTRFPIAVGWLTGTIGSAFNFYWLSRNVMDSVEMEANKSKVKSFKAFYLRFLALAVYSTAVILLLKPDILVFGMGLVSIQLAIYGYLLYEIIESKLKEKEYRER